MGKILLTFLLAGVLGVAMVLRASAQPIIRVEYSVEYLSANSDSIALAKLVEFKDSGQEGTGQRELTLLVERTLKGPHEKKIRIESYEVPSKLETWKREAHALLVFRSSDNFAEPEHVVDLVDDDLTMLTKGFQILDQKEQVLQKVQESLAEMPGVKRVQAINLEIPPEVTSETTWLNAHGALVTVPVDRDLEKVAREYCKSDRYSHRCKGVRALRYFRSPENIKIVKGLLNDPDWGYLRHAEQNEGVEVRYYGVRAEAFDTLEYLGIDVKQPQLREEVNKNTE